MLKMLNQSEIRISVWRNVVAAIVPAAIIVFFLAFLAESYNEDRRVARKSQQQIHIISELRQGILLLQKIRGLEQMYHYSRNEGQVNSRYARQLNLTKEEFIAYWESMPGKLKQPGQENDNQVLLFDGKIRKKLAAFPPAQEPDESFAEYTDLIGDLQLLIYHEFDLTLRHLDEIDILRSRLSLISQHIHNLIENTGRLRGFGSGRLTMSANNPEDVREWYALLGTVHRSFEDLSRAVRTIDDNKLQTDIRFSGEMELLEGRLERLTDAIESKVENTVHSLTAEEYFSMASDTIESAVLIHGKVDKVLLGLEEIKYGSAMHSIESVLALGIFALITLGLLTYSLMQKNSAALWNMRRANEALAVNESQLRSIIEMVPGMIVLRDIQGNILMANEQFINLERDLDDSDEKDGRDEPGGSKLENLFKADESVQSSGMPMHGEQEVIYSPTGQSRVLRISKIPYQLNDAKKSAVLTVAYDVTDLYMIRKLQDVAGVGYWEWDFKRDKFVISEVYAMKFDQVAQDDLGINGYIRGVDDVDKIMVRNAFERARLLKIPVELEHRARDKNGEMRTVRLKSRFYHRSVDNSLMLVGSVQDVSVEKEATRALQMSEVKYRKLVENLRGGYFFYSYTLDDKCTYVSPSIEGVLGLPASEALGSGLLSRCFLHSTCSIGHDDAVSDAGWRRHKELEVRREDGTLRYLELSEVPVYDSQGSIVGYDGIAHDITEHRLIEQDLRESEACMRALAGHLENVREMEREKMAHDIHDELGGYLVALKMDISLLSKRLDKLDTRMQSRFNSMKQLLDIAIDTTRRIITSLRPSILDELGLLEAIEWQLNQFGERFNLHVSLSRDFEPHMLRLHDAEYNVAVFRIFQEILNNIARHSQASSVVVRASLANKYFELQVADNGKGIYESELHRPGSYGILGMRERINSMNGVFDIHGSSGTGTTVTVRVPVEEGQAAGGVGTAPSSPALPYAG